MKGKAVTLGLHPSAECDYMIKFVPRLFSPRLLNCVGTCPGDSLSGLESLK